MAEFRITAHKHLNTVRVKCKLGNKMMSGWDILHYLKNAKGLSCVEELLLKTEKDFGEKPSIYENYIELGCQKNSTAEQLAEKLNVFCGNK